MGEGRFGWFRVKFWMEGEGGMEVEEEDWDCGEDWEGRFLKIYNCWFLWRCGEEMKY